MLLEFVNNTVSLLNEECRTRHINAEFSNCLAREKKYRCNYAFLFGDGYLCTHPNHREFATSSAAPAEL